MLHRNLARYLSLGAILLSCQLTSAPVLAADTAGMVREIQKSFSSIQRKIVTQPKQAETLLAESMALFEQLKAADPADSNIPRLEKKIEQLNAKLSKRLGHSVKPVQSTASAAPKPATKTLAPPPEPAPTATAAAGAEKLPSAVSSRIKKIDKMLDNTNKALDRNSVQRAEMEFKKVDKTLKEIHSRYGDKIPAGHPEMTALDERIAAVDQRLQASAGAAAASAAEAQKAEDDNAALAEAWIGKMTPYVARDSDKRLNERLHELSGEAAAANRRHYDEALALFQEYETVVFPLGKPMDLRNTENSLRNSLQFLQESYGKQATEQGSAEWIGKLEPFVTSMGGKQLIASYTSNVQQMQRQKQIYDEASALFEQYLQAEFPQGKSHQLQTIEDKLADELAKFPDVLKRSIGGQVDNAESKLDQEIAFLNGKQEWRNDATKLPYALSAQRIDDARALVARAAELLPADAPELARLNGKMAELVQTNDERIKVRVQRTRMIPDRFAGDGSKAIKDKAVALVKGKFSAIQILRSTVISEDWKEESVREWTDTTQTAVRDRTTRSVTAQVAGRKDNGEVRLYTLHVAKDLRSDGSWSKLYGNLHSDLGDLILEENVRK